MLAADGNVLVWETENVGWEISMDSFLEQGVYVGFLGVVCIHGDNIMPCCFECVADLIGGFCEEVRNELLTGLHGITSSKNLVYLIVNENRDEGCTCRGTVFIFKNTNQPFVYIPSKFVYLFYYCV